MTPPFLRYIGLALLALLLATGLLAGSYEQGKAPAVAGITLGMSPGDVRAALGAPELQQVSLGMRFSEYRARGITVIWRDDTAGVHGIVLSKPDAGDVNGVRVGDPARTISSNWGQPVRIRQSGRFLDFAGRGWILSAEVAKGRTIEITLLAAR